mmetsp:Transcript_46627/g.77688  ORF Transcript_46627/g.77688 Transcript_46627/m.77688 type:complete len:1396 (+) Transcript_46627:50-4237(+)
MAPRYIELPHNQEPNSFYASNKDETGRPRWKAKAEYILKHTVIGAIHDVLLIVFGFGSCALFVYDWYDPNFPGDFPLSVAFSSFFVSEYILRVAIAKIWWQYVLSWYGLADLLSVLPVLHLFYSDNQVILFLRVFVTFRLIRFIRHSRRLLATLNPIIRAVIFSAADLLVFLYAAAGILHLLEVCFGTQFADGTDASSTKTMLRFHEAIYFLTVTLATVGYGVVFPETPQGRVFGTVYMLVAVFLVPLETGRVLDAVFNTPEYKTKYRASKTKPHVVVGGHVSAVGMRYFFEEFFHPLQWELRQHVVVLRPYAPEPFLVDLIRSFSYRQHVTYIQGSFLDENDLHAAEVQRSTGCILMANEFAKNTEEEDAAIVHLAKAVKKYSPHVQTFLQLLSPIKTDEIRESFELVVCINELKMGIMARSVVCPGAVTLLCNMFASHVQTIMVDETGMVGRHVSAADVVQKMGSLFLRNKDYWLAEYDYGFSQEVFMIYLEEPFAGMSFADAAAIMYTQYSVLLLAVEVLDEQRLCNVLLVNPKDLILHTDDLVLVLAVSDEEAADVNDYHFVPNEDDDMIPSTPSVYSSGPNSLSPQRDKVLSEISPGNSRHGPSDSSIINPRTSISEDLSPNSRRSISGHNHRPSVDISPNSRRSITMAAPRPSVDISPNARQSITRQRLDMTDSRRTSMSGRRPSISGGQGGLRRISVTGQRPSISGHRQSISGSRRSIAGVRGGASQRMSMHLVELRAKESAMLRPTTASVRYQIYLRRMASLEAGGRELRTLPPQDPFSSLPSPSSLLSRPAPPPPWSPVRPHGTGLVRAPVLGQGPGQDNISPQVQLRPTAGMGLTRAPVPMLEQVPVQQDNVPPQAGRGILDGDLPLHHDLVNGQGHRSSPRPNNTDAFDDMLVSRNVNESTGTTSVHAPQMSPAEGQHPHHTSQNDESRGTSSAHAPQMSPAEGQQVLPLGLIRRAASGKLPLSRSISGTTTQQDEHYGQVLHQELINRAMKSKSVSMSSTTSSLDSSTYNYYNNNNIATGGVFQPSPPLSRQSSLMTMIPPHKSSFFHEYGGGGGVSQPSPPISRQTSNLMTPPRKSSFSSSTPASPRHFNMSPSFSSLGIPQHKALPSSMEGHILFCGTQHGVGTFLASLRSDKRTEEAQRPVVVLHPDEPDVHLLLVLSSFTGVYFVQGTPLLLEDLHRAAIRKASAAIIAIDESHMSDITLELSDAFAISAVLNIETLAPKNIRYIVELVEEQNMAHLQLWATAPDLECRLWPIYARGSAFIHSSLNALLSQAFFRGPQLVQLLEALVGVSATAGKARSNVAPLQNPTFPYQLPTPEEFVGKTYQDLFLHLLLEKGVLPLGLYRAQRTAGSVLPFVYTNPQRSTPLVAGDMVYVIDHTPV